MIGLTIAIIAFNFIAVKANKRLTSSQIVHIWVFTIAFQNIFDLLVEFKYHGYWYFRKEVDWFGLIPHTVLLPPVNIMLLNWFPFKSILFKQVIYITCWTIGILIYEVVASLPNPWGFFHLGWWKVWYDIIIVPILILILLRYYKWICKLEKKPTKQQEE